MTPGDRQRMIEIMHLLRMRDEANWPLSHEIANIFERILLGR